VDGITRVRWGTASFWRINEFESVADAREFVVQLRHVHRDRPGFVIVIERRLGDRWLAID